MAFRILPASLLFEQERSCCNSENTSVLTSVLPTVPHQSVTSITPAPATTPSSILSAAASSGATSSASSASTSPTPPSPSPSPFHHHVLLQTPSTTSSAVAPPAFLPTAGHHHFRHHHHHHLTNTAAGAAAAAAAAAAATTITTPTELLTSSSPHQHQLNHPNHHLTHSQSVTTIDMDQLNKTVAAAAGTAWPANLALIMKAAAVSGGAAAPTPATTTEEASSSNSNGACDIDKCWVCGCSANGRHYGVMACFGCKGFFRRSVQGGKNYVCRHERNCVIDQNDRNCCRACRFEKCLYVGMDPAAIQPDRDKTGRQRNPRKSQYSTNRNYPTISDRHSDGRESTPISNVGAGDISISPIDQTIMNTLLEIETICKDMKAEISTPYQNMETAVQKPSTVYSRTTVSFDGKMGPASLSKLKDDVLRLCVLKLDYVTTLRPLADVNVSDKMAIIRQYLCPFMILEVGFQSAQHTDSDDIFLPSGHIISGSQAFFSPEEGDDKSRVIMEDKISSLRRNFLDQLVNQLRRLRITSSELAAVKAIMVLDPNAPGLSQDSIELLKSGREAVQRALFAHVQGRLPPEGATARFAHLLMLITSVTRLSSQVVSFIQYLKETNIFSDTVFTDFFLHGW